MLDRSTAVTKSSFSGSGESKKTSPAALQSPACGHKLFCKKRPTIKIWDEALIDKNTYHKTADKKVLRRTPADRYSTYFGTDIRLCCGEFFFTPSPTRLAICLRNLFTVAKLNICPKIVHPAAFIAILFFQWDKQEKWWFWCLLGAERFVKKYFSPSIFKFSKSHLHAHEV